MTTLSQPEPVLEGGVAAFITRVRRYDNELSTYRRDLTAAERPPRSGSFLPR
jgi:hypothetical protein